LHGCNVFSKIDLVKGYHQIPVAAADIQKTAIITPSGLFEYLLTPFGLSNAAKTLMDRSTDGLDMDMDIDMDMDMDIDMDMNMDIGMDMNIEMDADMGMGYGHVRFRFCVRGHVSLLALVMFMCEFCNASVNIQQTLNIDTDNETATDAATDSNTDFDIDTDTDSASDTGNDNDTDIDRSWTRLWAQT
jgi:hypothetical protein